MVIARPVVTRNVRAWRIWVWPRDDRFVRRWFRVLFSWFPIQSCVICKRLYWGRFPVVSDWLGLSDEFWAWLPEWQRYCSCACEDAELDRC